MLEFHPLTSHFPAILISAIENSAIEFIFINDESQKVFYLTLIEVSIKKRISD